MEALFSFDGVVTLMTLILLQAVFSIDNVLYIALTSNKAAPEKRSKIRKQGIIIAMVLRIVCIFALTAVIEHSKDYFFEFTQDWFEVHLNAYGCILLIGGLFLLYTGIHELKDIAAFEKHGLDHDDEQRLPYWRVLLLIIGMNLLFSADSILSTVAFTDVFAIMAIAVVTGSLIMYFFADKLAAFIHRSKDYEIIGLMMLLLVGFMLFTEGLHESHLMVYHHEFPVMEKQAFYYCILSLVSVQYVKDMYKKKMSKGSDSTVNTH